MKIVVEKPLVMNEKFRIELATLVREYGYDMLWLSTTEADLFEITNLPKIHEEK